MNPFLREHVRPLIGSALLHALVAAAALAATWFSVAPKWVPPPAIEAYLVPAPRSHAGELPEAAPAAAPQPATESPPAPAKAVPVAPAPDPAALERERRAAAAAKVVEARHAAQLAEDRTADARRRQAERDAKRRVVAQAQAEETRAAAAKALARRKAAAEEARAHAAAVEEQRRLEAETRRLDAEKQARAQREADLAHQLADEQQRLGAQNSGLQARYVAALRARIERAWNRPPTAKAGIRCIVDVSQVPGGTVTDVKVGDCNGDAAVVESIKLAVFRASPLPPPPDPTLFERKLHLVFNPDG